MVGDPQGGGPQVGVIHELLPANLKLRMQDGADLRGKGQRALVRFIGQVVPVELKRLPLLRAATAKKALGPDGQDKGDDDNDKQAAKEPFVVLEKEVLQPSDHIGWIEVKAGDATSLLLPVKDARERSFDSPAWTGGRPGKRVRTRAIEAPCDNP